MNLKKKSEIIYLEQLFHHECIIILNLKEKLCQGCPNSPTMAETPYTPATTEVMGVGVGRGRGQGSQVEAQVYYLKTFAAYGLHAASSTALHHTD